MFSRGQIVSIKCINVLTYDEIVIYPCEKLNMIIGANGSGKSTLISAIILGLGGNPAIVGRATELQKYIKMGKSNAEIEIELFNPNGNDIIRRKFNTKNQSRFQLNGKEIPIDKIQKLMRKYHIQINNLCQILPQEKLEEFAKMNDHERLEGTIKTVGNQNLADWFKELKESKSFEQTVNKKLDNLKSELAQTVKKKDDLGLEAKVINEKQFLIESLKLLKQRRAWQLFYHLKETIVKIDDALSSKKEVCQNMVHLLRKCKSNLRTLSQDVSGQDRIIKQTNDQLLHLIKEVKHQQNEITNMTDQITEIKTEYLRKLNKSKTQEKDMQQLSEAVNHLKDQIHNINNLYDEVEYTMQQIKEQERKVREIAHTKDMISYEMETKVNEINSIDRRLTRLNDVMDYKMKILEQYYHDSWVAVKWVESNRHLFKGQVYGPLFLNITVSDVTNAKFVENCVGNRDLLAFMCEYRDDTTAMLVELAEKRKLKVNVISALNVDRRSLEPKYSIERLKPFGFHSYVLDFIEGPDMIVNYLAATYNLHNIPVGNSYTEKVVNKIPSDVRVFFTDKLRFSIAVARLTKLKIESSSQLSEPRFLKVSVNQKECEELQKQKWNLDEELKQIREKKMELEQSVSSGDSALNDLRNRLKKLKSEQSSHSRLKETLKSKERDLNHLKNNVIDIAIEKNKCDLNVELKLSQVCNKFIDLGNFVNELNNCYLRLQKEKMKKEQHEKIYFKNLQVSSTFVVALKQEASSLRKLELKKKKMLKVSNLMHQFALKCTGGIDPTSRQFKRRKYFQKLNTNVTVIYRLINKFNAKINCLSSSDKGLQIIVEYRRYAKEAEKLKHKIDKKESHMKTYFQHIDEIKKKWIEEVEKLIGTINENFGRFFANMNCAGEISFHKGEVDDDYNNYGIHIKVKFREEGNLQILNAHTQSGGERAVSVAIYLLSLQELTSVPFRCIDEINQGMDADNERRIFNLLTKATEDSCQTQYFLLTPKLLPNLIFTSSMQIFCPFNGLGSISQAQLPSDFLRHSQPMVNSSQSSMETETLSQSQNSLDVRSPSPRPSTSSQYHDL